MFIDFVIKIVIEECSHAQSAKLELEFINKNEKITIKCACMSISR